MSSEILKNDWLHMMEVKKKLLEDLSKVHASKNVADYMEYISSIYSNQTALVSVENPSLCLTYAQLNESADRFGAYVLNEFKLFPKDVISLVMENRPEFPIVTIGMAKIGVTSALINYNLRDNLLEHALNVSKCKLIVISSKQVRTLLSLPKESFYLNKKHVLIIVSSLDEQNHLTSEGFQTVFIPNLPPANLPSSLRSLINERDPFVYIYTSGTTGPSKAAKFSHRRWIGCGVTWKGPSKLKQGSSYYISLPLYHGNGGAVALSSAFLAGCRVVLREKFSVSSFFNDISTFNCSTMIYIGELWRYLSNSSASHLDRNHSLRTIVGNGLRAELWNNIVQRFGIETIVEHYGSTEMPGDAILQWFGKIGSCGYVPTEFSHLYSGVIIQYNVESRTPKVNSGSPWAIKCKIGEPGELVMPLPHGEYDGYVDQTQTENKLYRNLFQEGDVYYSTGDILKVDENGFYFFIDRTGDTFRWKGENVSTYEIEITLSSYLSIAEASVFGVEVPIYDGKAGMAVINLKQDLDFDLIDFGEYITKKLPKFSIPIFLRIIETEINKTSTLKFQKNDYVKEGFKSAQYVFLGGKYEQLSQATIDSLEKGSIRL